MIQLSYQTASELFNSKNYAFFKGNYNLNLFAIRSKNSTINRFDDTFFIAYEKIVNNKIDSVIESFACTVDPGDYWMINPMDPGGTAAIYPGQYRGVWKLGYFRGTKALLQVRNFKIYRDNNKDRIFDYNPLKTTEGLYGLFMHRHFQRVNPASFVSTSSAGCVVPEDDKNMDRTILLVENQNKAGYGTTCTFTLFEEDEL